jgi:hypothetical protein
VSATLWIFFVAGLELAPRSFRTVPTTPDQN